MSSNNSSPAVDTLLTELNTLGRVEGLANAAAVLASQGEALLSNPQGADPLPLAEAIRSLAQEVDNLLQGGLTPALDAIWNDASQSRETRIAMVFQTAVARLQLAVNDAETRVEQARRAADAEWAAQQAAVARVVAEAEAEVQKAKADADARVAAEAAAFEEAVRRHGLAPQAAWKRLLGWADPRGKSLQAQLLRLAILLALTAPAAYAWYSWGSAQAEAERYRSAYQAEKAQKEAIERVRQSDRAWFDRLKADFGVSRKEGEAAPAGGEVDEAPRRRWYFDWVR